VVRPGRPLTDRELRRLRSLHEAREQAHADARRLAEELEDLALSCCETGSSVRVVAEALGVGFSTVHGWTRNARRRRDG